MFERQVAHTFELPDPPKVTIPPLLGEALTSRRIITSNWLVSAAQGQTGHVGIRIPTMLHAQVWFVTVATWLKCHRVGFNLPGLTRENVGAMRARHFHVKERALAVLREAVAQTPMTDDQRLFVVERTIASVPDMAFEDPYAPVRFAIAPVFYAILTGQERGGTQRVLQAGRYYHRMVMQRRDDRDLVAFAERIEKRGKQYEFTIRGPEDDRLIQTFDWLVRVVLNSEPSCVETYTHTSLYADMGYLASGRRAARAQSRSFTNALMTYRRRQKMRREALAPSPVKVPRCLPLANVPGAFFQERSLPAMLKDWGQQEREWLTPTFAAKSRDAIPGGMAGAATAFQAKRWDEADRRGHQKKAYERFGAVELETGGQPIILEPAEIDWNKTNDPDLFFWRWWPGADRDAPPLPDHMMPMIRPD